MKRVLFLLLIVGKVYAQPKVPTETIRSDSSRRLTIMPNARPAIGFYRDPKDPANIRRSTLDNMPVKGLDTNTIYTMPQKRYDSFVPKAQEEPILPRRKP